MIKCNKKDLFIVVNGRDRGVNFLQIMYHAVYYPINWTQAGQIFTDHINLEVDTTISMSKVKVDLPLCFVK